MNSIEERLKAIENELFIKTNQKLDSYFLAIIRASLMANEPLMESNLQLNATIKNILKPQQSFFNGSVSVWFRLSAKFFFPSVTVAFLGSLIYIYSKSNQQEKEIQKEAERIVSLSIDFAKKEPKMYTHYFNSAITEYQLLKNESGNNSQKKSNQK